MLDEINELNSKADNEENNAKMTEAVKKSNSILNSLGNYMIQLATTFDVTRVEKQLTISYFKKSKCIWYDCNKKCASWNVSFNQMPREHLEKQCDTGQKTKKKNRFRFKNTICQSCYPFSIED